MKLEHQFTVPAPIEQTWEALNDLERVVPCFPGASLSSVQGEEFTGSCKVKLGPISLQYNGSGRFVSRDESAHRAVIEAKGKDRRGNGTASATITAALSPAGESSTTVSVETDLSVTGKPAQFGRGVMQDVSDKMLASFTECLQGKLGTAPVEEPVPTPAPAATATAEAEDEEGGSVYSATEPAEAAEPGTEPPGPVHAPEERTAEREPAALDLGATVLPVLVKRYGPYALATVALLALLIAVRRILRS